MKKYSALTLALAFALGCVLLFSCEKSHDEASVLGKWKLEAISIAQPDYDRQWDYDYSSENVFISFEKKTILDDGTIEGTATLYRGAMSSNTTFYCFQSKSIRFANQISLSWSGGNNGVADFTGDYLIQELTKNRMVLESRYYSGVSDNTMSVVLSKSK